MNGMTINAKNAKNGTEEILIKRILYIVYIVKLEIKNYMMQEIFFLNLQKTQKKNNYNH
jgi:hypothetical protein